MKQSIDRQIYNQIKYWTTLKPENAIEKMKEYLTTVKPLSYRTNQQSRALYLHFGNISNELQNKGITQRGFYQKAKYFDMPCTKEFIHDMWLGLQKKMYNTDSTKLLEKHEQIDKLNDVLMKGLGETCDIEYMPIPCDMKRQWEKYNYSEYKK